MMALFKKKAAVSAADSPNRPRFGPGRRVASDLDPSGCFETISSVLEAHAPTRYEHMPTLHEASVIWHGERPPPSDAWSCNYGADDVFVFVVWPKETETELGLFPLGATDRDLNTPFIGQWKQVDDSLRSVGEFDSGQFTLLTPELGQVYFDEMLRLAGKPLTDKNLDLVGEQVTQQFCIKAYEFISKIGHDERGGSRFVDSHRWDGDLALPQRVLKDLGDWNYQAVPYLQDLPWRVQGILLERGPDARFIAALWNEMDS
jgi:hypothetical protein